jgi:hypothetical protein
MHTKQSIRDLLHTDTPVGHRALERALLVLLANQTFDERRDQTTKHYNNRGFMPMDARKMTSFAKQVQYSRRPKGEQLSPKQRAWLLRTNAKGVSRIGKYARQLIEAAQQKVADATNSPRD